MEVKNLPYTEPSSRESYVQESRHLTASDVVEIIKACGDSRVESISFQDLQVTFNPLMKSQELAAIAEQVDASIKKVSDEIISNESGKTLLAPQDALLQREQYLDDLLMMDPAKYEEEMISIGLENERISADAKDEYRGT